MYASFNSSAPSVIHIKFSANEPSEKEFDEYLNALQKIVDLKKRTVLVFDSTETKYLSSDLRIKQGHWIKQNQEELKKNIIGGAFIIPSMVMRIVFNCILTIQKLPYPHTVVSNKEDAFTWAMDREGKASLPV